MRKDRRHGLHSLLNGIPALAVSVRVQVQLGMLLYYARRNLHLNFLQAGILQQHIARMVRVLISPERVVHCFRSHTSKQHAGSQHAGSAGNRDQKNLFQEPFRKQDACIASSFQSKNMWRAGTANARHPNVKGRPEEAFPWNNIRPVQQLLPYSSSGGLRFCNHMTLFFYSLQKAKQIHVQLSSQSRVRSSFTQNLPFSCGRAVLFTKSCTTSQRSSDVSMRFTFMMR